MADAAHVDLATARRILAGDEVAFRSLFDRYFPRLYRFALARLEGDHDAASDIVQQTFCRAVERLDSYRGEAALYTWFHQICRNTLLDYYRYTSRRARVVVPLEDLPDVRAVLETLAAPLMDEPETGVWRSDVRRLVQTTVDALPARYGEILEWKYVDEQPLKQIAQQLGISDKAAESLLMRARTAFCEAIAAMVGATDAFEPPARS
ncbi:MAG: sigma-70 family RNA polymerase sigma factor [Steroidobacteraceae bacterium]